jgi:hypothetical protein
MRITLLLPALLLFGCAPSPSPDPAADVPEDVRAEGLADVPAEVGEDAAPEIVPDGAADAPADVAAGPLRLIHQFPPVIEPGAAVEVVLAAEGGAPPYAWALTLGELPPGIVLDPGTGVLSGDAPLDGGLAIVLITVTDDAGSEAAEVYGLRIGDPGVDGPLRQRAREYQEIYEARHLWHGMSLGAKAPDDPGGQLDLTTYGDCAFVSGNCTMAQAYRYAVEPGPGALAVVTEQAEGWRFFQELTGVPGLIGRCYAHETDPWEPWMWDNLYPVEDKYAGTGAFEGWLWQADTSRDQVTGAVLGVAALYDLVDDAHVRETAAAFLGDLADHVWDHDLKLVDPDGEMTTHGHVDGEWLEGFPFPNGLNASCVLMWLKAAWHATGEERFRDYCEELAVDRDYVSIMRENMWVYMGYQTKYYNTYMAFETMFHLTRLEEDPTLFEAYREIFRDTLWLNTDDKTVNRKGRLERNPTKTGWYLAATGYEDPEALYWATRQIAEFPAAPLRDTKVQNSADPAIEVNPDKPDEALHALPAAKLPPDMVIWHRSTFKLDGGQDTGEERTGCDYMLPYWLGRHGGWIAPTW